MKVTFVTGVVVIVAAAAALSEFTTALVVQFCVGGGGHGAAARRSGCYTPRKPTDRLHERTNERTIGRANEGGDGRTATSCFN